MAAPPNSRPFTVDHFENWIASLILDRGGAVRLEAWQRAFVRDVFAGRPVNWLVVPEGNGKTTLLAALGLYALKFSVDAVIPIAASTRDQCRILYRQAKGFVYRSGLRTPDTDGTWFQCFDGLRQIHKRSPSDKTRRGDVAGLIEVYSADAGTADGVIPYPFAFLDELHRHKDLALHRTWRGKLNKRGAQLIVISTAGEPGHDFELTRERIKAETKATRRGSFARFVSDQVVMHEWAVRDEADVLDVKAVAKANPLRAITPAALQAKLDDPTMTQPHWRRFTCNIATLDEGKAPFIDLAEWDALAEAGLHVPAGASVYLGADGSRTWDTTVIAWAWPVDDLVYVDARVFSVRGEIDAHVHHVGGKIDFGDVEAFVLDRFDQFDVLEAAYDPRYLERSMEIVDVRLAEQRVFAVEPSSKHMRDALQAMFNLAAEGKLRHPGDPVHRVQVANAGAERGYASELRRVRKIDQRLPIDVVPAMALALWRACQDEASVYDDRELVLV